MKRLNILEVAPERGSTRLIAERLVEEFRGLGQEAVLLAPERLTWRSILQATAGRRIDIVHTHFGRAAARFARLRPMAKWSVAASFHGFHSASRQRRADGFTAVSSAVARHYADQGVAASGITVIPNAAFPQHREPAAQAERMRTRRDPVLQIGSVGALSPVKNYAALIEGFAAALDVRADLRLTIVGDGPERAALERIAHDRAIAQAVTFAGHVADLRAVYPQWDVYVQPSLNEGFCMPLLEAMSMGVAVAATPSRGPMDYIRHGVSGWIADDASPAGVKTAILALAGDAALRRRLGEAGRDTAAHYDWRSVAERHLVAFRRILHRRA